MSLGLVYLSRGLDGGLLATKAFFSAYCDHPAGCPHELIVIMKGWFGVNGEDEIRQLAKTHSATVIDLPDDGFDWGAYMRVAPLLKHDFVCFCNTHSRPLVDGWLDLLKKSAESDSINIGAVGATASYQGCIPPFPWPPLRKKVALSGV